MGVESAVPVSPGMSAAARRILWVGMMEGAPLGRREPSDSRPIQERSKRDYEKRRNPLSLAVFAAMVSPCGAVTDAARRPFAIARPDGLTQTFSDGCDAEPAVMDGRVIRTDAVRPEIA